MVFLDSFDNAFFENTLCLPKLGIVVAARFALVGIDVFGSFVRLRSGLSALSLSRLRHCYTQRRPLVVSSGQSVAMVSGNILGIMGDIQ